MKVCVLAGGTGGALLAAGFLRVVPADALSVVTNTADDLELWGLHISPDTDSVVYRLAGIFNDEAGFGLAGESFAALDMLRRYGEPTWFQIGDRDLATHLLRARMLAAGMRLTEATADLVGRLGLACRVLPMSDDAVRTWFETDLGRLSFQEYFVRERCLPTVRGLVLAGLESARPSPEAVEAVAAADLVVLGPSNPVISLAPILRLLGDHFERRSAVAVTPIVGGRALKGPTVEMLRGLGREATPAAVAAGLAPHAATFVLDEVDRASVAEVRAGGVRVVVADTVMGDLGGAERLARLILEVEDFRSCPGSD
ncbi:MAG: 2-phospho-L-lactate transferase [Candidatus Dormibacteraceae bacterium]